jgi:hypothetical protein
MVWFKTIKPNHFNSLVQFDFKDKQFGSVIINFENSLIQFSSVFLQNQTMFIPTHTLPISIHKHLVQGVYWVFEQFIISFIPQT